MAQRSGGHQILIDLENAIDHLRHCAGGRSIEIMVPDIRAFITRLEEMSEYISQ